MVSQLFLLVRGYIAVPTMDGYFQFLAEFFEPTKLVVDERLERANIERLHGWLWASSELRNDRKEGSLGLASSRRRTDDEVVFCLANRMDGLDLNRLKFLPAHLPNGLLNSGTKKGKCLFAHQSLKVSKSSAVSSGGGTPIAISSSADEGLSGFARKPSPRKPRQSRPGFCSTTLIRPTKERTMSRGVL